MKNFADLSALIHDWLAGDVQASQKAYNESRLPGMQVWLLMTGWTIRAFFKAFPEDILARDLHEKRAHADLVRSEGAFARAIYAAWADGRLGAWVELVAGLPPDKRYASIQDQLGIRGHTIPGFEALLAAFPVQRVGEGAARVHDEIWEMPVGFFGFLRKELGVVGPIGTTSGPEYKQAWAELLYYRGTHVDHWKREYRSKIEREYKERTYALKDNRSDR